MHILLVQGFFANRFVNMGGTSWGVFTDDATPLAAVWTRGGWWDIVYISFCFETFAPCWFSKKGEKI